jgi:hypothetical protein
MKEVVVIDPMHIEVGIKKYEGTVDAHIESLIQSAGLQYKPYVFKDGRVLLVLPNKVAAILYASEEVLFKTLNLAS